MGEEGRFHWLDMLRASPDLVVRTHPLAAHADYHKVVTDQDHPPLAETSARDQGHPSSPTPAQHRQDPSLYLPPATQAFTFNTSTNQYTRYTSPAAPAYTTPTSPSTDYSTPTSSFTDQSTPTSPFTDHSTATSPTTEQSAGLGPAAAPTRTSPASGPGAAAGPPTTHLPHLSSSRDLICQHDGSKCSPATGELDYPVHGEALAPPPTVSPHGDPTPILRYTITNLSDHPHHTI